MLADNLKILRHQKRITQGELAGKLGITQQAVARWESGKSEPDVSTLRWLANYFGVSTDYLIGNEGTVGVYLTKEQVGLLRNFDELTTESRHTLRHVLDGLLARQAAIAIK